MLRYESNPYPQQKKQTIRARMIFRMCAVEIRRLALRAKLRRQQADDIVQTVCMKFLEQNANAIGKDELEQWHAWLLTVARHEIANVRREARRHPMQSLDALPLEPRDKRGDEPSALDREALLGKQREVLEELRKSGPLNHRLVIGHHIEGRSIKKLAEAEGLTVHAVWDRLHRARAWLRKRLTDSEDE